MATVEECERALHTLSDRLSRSDHPAGAKLGHKVLACVLTDPPVTFFADLRDGGLRDVRRAGDDGVPDGRRAGDDAVPDGRLAGDDGDQTGAGEPPRPDATLRMTGDDLIALVDGQLGLAAAFTSGRLRIDASLLDLLRVRSFF